MTLFLLSLGSFLAKISRKLGKFGAYVAAFGGPGLFVICLLDSSFVPLPSVADALLIALSTSNPHWIDKYDFLSVLVASVLPPPFPLKLFVVTTGVMRLSVIRFALAIAAGRA